MWPRDSAKDFRVHGCISRKSRTVVSSVFMDQARREGPCPRLARMDDGAWKVFMQRVLLRPC